MSRLPEKTRRPVDFGTDTNYCALALGLHHGFFKMLCETMVKEAQEFDAKMHEAGLLR